MERRNSIRAPQRSIARIPFPTSDMTGHIDSYYARTAAPGPDYPALAGPIDTDICIVGGGLAGLSAGLSLAERGRAVVLLEANKVGWGASGRNGGFVSPGFSGGLERLLEICGAKDARSLLDLTRDAVRLVRSRIDRYAIPAEPVDSGMIGAWWRDDPDEARREQEFLATHFDVETEWWPKERLREVLVSERYHGGLYRREGFHFHPLNYARGVAKALADKGGRIFEGSAAMSLELDGTIKRIKTAAGEVRARIAILCCGGYIRRLEPRLASAIKPVATYVMVTEPLGQRLGSAIKGPYAVHDSRFDFDYYRPLPDTRILWGGGVTMFGENPPRLAQWLRKRMLAVYPQLADVKVELAWGGLMGYPAHKMPQLGQLEPNVWYAMGYGGHGMGTTAMTGELVASAITEDDPRWKLLAPFGLKWTGGVVGTVYGQLVYWYYKTLDWARG
jgi:gamma-glutamylputrescine oxidase